MKKLKFITGYLVAVLVLPIVAFLSSKFLTLNFKLRGWVNCTDFGLAQIKKSEEELKEHNGDNPF